MIEPSMFGGSIDDLTRDDDCTNQGTGVVPADGLVYAQLVTDGEPPGPGTVTVTDDVTGDLIGTIPFTVVGSGHDVVEIETFETAIQGTSSAADCFLPPDLSTLLATGAADPAKSAFLVHVKDTFGNDVTGAWVHVTVDDPMAAVVALPDSPAIDLGDGEIAARA